MKNKNRIQILQKIASKSDEIMDDLIKVTMQVYATQPRLCTHLNEIALLVESSSDTKNKNQNNN